MTTPCEHCGKALRLELDTDGNGEVVEVGRQQCDCEMARWGRGECMDCGVKVRRRSNNGPRPRRCPEHIALRDLKRSRESMRQAYREDPERFRPRAREQYRKRRKNPAIVERERRRAREAYRLEQKIRRGHLRRCPPEVKHLRDRLIYRLRENEGWNNREIGDALGIGSTYVSTLYQRQRRFREQQSDRWSA